MQQELSVRRSVAGAVAALIVAVLSAAAGAEENASNPLAAVNNTDLRWQYTSDDGAYMLMPKLKLKYELITI